MIEEPQLKIENIEGLRYDIALVVKTISGESGTIKTHKALLVMYSQIFNIELAGESFKPIEDKMDLTYEVSEISVMEKLIKSFYKRNTSEMIKNEPYEKKLELLRICNFYEIKIPILSFLAEITVGEGYEDFIETLDEINPYNKEWQSNIIATKISREYILGTELSGTMKTFILNGLSYLVLVTDDQVFFKDLATNENIFKIEGNDYKLAFYSRNKQRLALLRGRRNEYVEIWEMTNIIPRIIYERKISGEFLCISPDGSYFAFAENPSLGVVNLVLVNIFTDEIKKFKIDDLPMRATISPSNKYIAYYICEGLNEDRCEIIIIDSDTGLEISSWRDSVNNMAFISDTIIVMLDNRGVFIVNRNFAQEENKFKQYDLLGYEMCVTMDKIILISSGGNAFIIKIKDEDIVKTAIKLDEHFNFRGQFNCSSFHVVYFSKFNEINVYSLVFGNVVFRIKNMMTDILSIAL